MTDRQTKWLGIALIVFFIAGCFAFGKFFDISFDQARDFLQRYPLWLQGLVYIGLYVVTTTLIVVGPKDVIRILGAIFFGGLVSTIFVYIAELFNAMIMFHMSRKVGREMVLKQWLGRHEKLAHIGDNTTLLNVMALRINLLFSFRLLDIAYGLTTISFQKYFLAAVIASPLRLYVAQSILAYIGEAIIRTPRAALLKLIGNQDFFQVAVAYMGTVAIVTVAALVQNASLKRKRQVEKLSDDGNSQRQV